MERDFLRWMRREVFRGERLGMEMPGPGLPQRVRTILAGGPQAQVSLTRLACIAVLIAGSGAMLTTGRLAHAQQVSFAFEVASVKRSPPPAPGERVFRGPAVVGRGAAGPTLVTWANVTLKSALVQAYGVKAYQITAPTWFDSELYDFAVSVPEGANGAQVAEMWQTLLAERFGLLVHHESKEFPVDELAVGRSGHKLKESAITGPVPEGPQKIENGKLVGAGMYTSMRSGPNGPMAELTVRGQGIASLINVLSNDLGHPVVDKTGLTGRYDFSVEFAPKPYLNMPDELRRPADATLDLATAVQQQLGLRLEKGRAPLDVIVVDNAEKIPTEN